MKKVFVEPNIKKIELNMRENIAASSSEIAGYYFQVDLFGCSIQDTGKYYGEYTREEAETCRISSKAKIGGGVIVPEEEVRKYFKY